MVNVSGVISQRDQEILLAMTEVTTIQVSKDTLADLNKKKLQFEAKLGKRISVDEYIQELLK